MPPGTHKPASPDAAGRLTATTNVDGSSSFHYDATGQLTAANHSYQANESYSYDASRDAHS